MTRSIFTVALGSTKYLNFAFNLARSYKLNSYNKNIDFYIITDIKFELPYDLSFVKVMIYPKGHFGYGLNFKFQFDKIAPSEKSIFIDSDCLIYHDISKLFEVFEGYVSVVGFKIISGEWCGLDIAETLIKHDLSFLPRFNGGIYFIKKGKEANKVYETARKLKESSQDFQQHRESINEEPVLSIAMAQHNQTVLEDHGDILSDLSSSVKMPNINVLYQNSELYNPIESSPKHKFWLKEGKFNPSIIHFGTGFYNRMPYLIEKYRLLMYFKFPFLGKRFSNFICFILIEIPYFVFKSLILTFNLKK